jgi:hypothetical protein
LQTWPKQTVVHDHKIDILFDAAARLVSRRQRSLRFYTPPEFSICRPLSALSQSPISECAENHLYS